MRHNKLFFLPKTDFHFEAWLACDAPAWLRYLVNGLRWALGLGILGFFIYGFFFS
jgi:hypothetical protein